jgi:hypothetical protein
MVEITYSSGYKAYYSDMKTYKEFEYHINKFGEEIEYNLMFGFKEAKKMIEEQKLAELQKCVESPYYFFTNHIRINGELVHTFLTEEEFNLIFKQWTNGKSK